MSSRVDSSDPAILQAYNEVKTPGASTRWIMLDYVPKSDNKLRVADKGTGGLDEMCEWLNDGKILFFLIWFEINKVRKFVYIPWCGEGVTGMKKGLFNNHANDVSLLFKGFHSQINARSDKDIKEKIIIEKLTKGTGAAYDAGGREQSTESKPVPSSIKYESRALDQSTESKPLQSTIKYESRALDQSTESKPNQSAIKYDARKLDQSTESNPNQSTLPGTRAGPTGGAPGGNAGNIRAKFEQQGREPAPPVNRGPAAPANRGPPTKFAPPPVKAAPPPAAPPPARPPPVRQPEPEPEPEPEQEPEPEPVQETYPEEPAYQEEQAAEFQPEESYGGEQNYAQEEQSYGQEEQTYGQEQQNLEPEQLYGQEETFDQGNQGSGGEIFAKALYDYDAENEGDLSFKEGESITVLDQSDPSGWWEGQLNGRRGFFPSNFAELTQ